MNNKSRNETKDSDFVETRECPYCDWEVEKEVVSDVDRYDLDTQAESHYERAHCGKVKVKAVFETEMRLPPRKTAREFSERQHDRLSEELPAGYELAYTVAETIEESDGGSDE